METSSCTSENPETTCCGSVSNNDGVDELSTSLPSQLEIEEEEEEEEEEDEDDLFEEELLAQMGYAESDPKTDYEETEEDEDLLHLKNAPPKQDSSHELNLVSALKGSREKEGRAVNERRVSWAPDVYDPPPTSDDHSVQSKKEKQRVETKAKPGSGKNKQKGGGGGGGGSKDKKKAEKKHKKRGGNSSKYSSNHGDF